MDEQSHADVVEQLRQFIERKHNMAALEPDRELLNSGLMDSLMLVEILLFIEDKYGISPAIDDIDENFGTLESIAAYVRRREDAR